MQKFGGQTNERTNGRTDGQTQLLSFDRAKLKIPINREIMTFSVIFLEAGGGQAVGLRHLCQLVGGGVVREKME